MYTPSASARFSTLLKAYSTLAKIRLTLFVAISASFGYAMAAFGSGFSWKSLGLITLAGALITGGANALNQVFEREWDAMMKRTAQRPLPTHQLSVREAVIFSVLCGLIGVGLLSYFFNLPAALLGIIGYLSYSFVYTPLKRISPFSVFIGAIPGALPPLIGWVAVRSSLDSMGLLLFAFQFIWQFPHFWAIAWIADEDYTRAGFKMLPSVDGKTQFSANVVLWYALSLIPLSVLPYWLGMLPLWSVGILAAAGIYFSIPAFRLSKSLADSDARKLMFASFLYLPLIQIVFLVGIAFS